VSKLYNPDKIGGKQWLNLWHIGEFSGLDNLSSHPQ